MSVLSWCTPKRVSQMDSGDEFVPLPQQEQTIYAGSVPYESLQKNLQTPYPAEKLKNTYKCGIFHSLGISNKLDIIHQETGEVVKNMIENGKDHLTDFKKLQQFESDGNLRGSPQTHLNTRTDRYPPQKLTPSQTSRCEGLFTAKDKIIEQKDIIMLKQKEIIKQLRQRNTELEEQLMHKDQIQMKSASYEYFHREHQQQIEKLHHEMNDNHSRKCVEIEKLQRKLGEKEYEVGKLHLALKENQFSNESAINKLVKKFETNNQALIEERDKSEKMKMEISNLRQEKEKLQSYLKELPTSEEFKELKSRLKEITQEHEEQKENKKKLQERYSKLKDDFVEKDFECQKYERLIFELKEETTRLNTTLKKYRLNNPVTIEEHESKLSEVSRLQRENKELRESRSKKHKKMEKLHYDHLAKQKELKNEKESLFHSLEVLNERLKERNIDITKLNARNQEILSKSLEYESKLKKLKEIYNEEYETEFQALYSEVICCFEDMKSLVNQCSSMSKGCEPNLVALLGLKDSPDKAVPSTSMNNMQKNDVNMLKEKIKTVKSIREEIDDLRQFVSDQYAEEIGKNMCITQ